MGRPLLNNYLIKSSASLLATKNKSFRQQLSEPRAPLAVFEKLINLKKRHASVQAPRPQKPITRSRIWFTVPQSQSLIFLPANTLSF
jgi:hypothetical protein